MFLQSKAGQLQNLFQNKGWLAAATVNHHGIIRQSTIKWVILLWDHL